MYALCILSNFIFKMNKRALSILIVFLVFFNCNDNNKKKDIPGEPIFKIVESNPKIIIEENNKNSNRLKLTIKNETFHYNANLNTKEKYYNASGEFMNDRFGAENSAIFLDVSKKKNDTFSY